MSGLSGDIQPGQDRTHPYRGVRLSGCVLVMEMNIPTIEDIFAHDVHALPHTDHGGQHGQ
ncbi:MAG: hypothetical protein FD177_1696 [Desulfovibrionaceae bacterium]|nr:MAG: hypothetical protein FD177_1696 [Desulfovibrionaceae bacterium]